MRLVLLALIALFSLGYCANLLSGAFGDAQCTTPFAGLKPGILQSETCVNASGTWVKINDQGTTYSGGFSCGAGPGCANCAITLTATYGVCSAITGLPAWAQVFKITDGTSLTLNVFDDQNCNTARGTAETYTSTAFPASCGVQQSTTMQGFVNVLDLGNGKVGIQTGCGSAPPCASCVNTVTGAAGACLAIKDGQGNNRWAKASPSGGTTNPSSTTPASTTTKPAGGSSSASVVVLSALAVLIAAFALMF